MKVDLGLCVFCNYRKAVSEVICKFSDGSMERRSFCFKCLKDFTKMKMTYRVKDSGINLDSKLKISKSELKRQKKMEKK